ncbi:MAG TPA: 1-deoxy-D-xylulose-5-phosphate synthase [Flavobacteriaceae bacterium]|nr:1-deoxy-D-xylulose-5-phosphate synthase [Flavobacteriaceae bacterium]
MSQNLLETISFPKDLRALSKDQLPQLAQELRDFIINVVAVKEGHLGASLGVVELTVALHYCFNTPDDKLVWDVGHQAYGHKILTGRKDVFHTNRTLNGISGFPKIEESVYDAFGTGHSSTAISASLGMAIAASLAKNNTRQHIAVVGDASIASGMAFEALNHAGVTDTNILIILNDNAIGIDPSVGALKQYFTKVTLEGSPDTDTIFEALNFDYTGVVDGHNIEELIAVFEKLQQKKGPKILHVITKKGKGLKQAEEDQVTYHAPGKFNPATGDRVKNNTAGLPPKFQDVFGHTLVELAKENDAIIGITPAMPTGSSLKYMMEAFPERAFDVGIAEQHAVTLSAGLASEGLHVFCNIYSTFLQRAYDQVIHDVCLQKLPVIFCLDRAGMVGEDGATHHGIFDIAFLRCIPNIIIAAPSNAIALRNILYTAQLGLQLPIAIRYPRGRGKIVDWKQPFKKIAIGQAEALKKGTTIALLCVGSMVQNAQDALDLLESQAQKDQVGIYDMCFVKPLDIKLLTEIFEHYTTIITIENGVINGGFGSSILEYQATTKYTNTIELLGIKDEFPEHASVHQLQDLQGISPEEIKQTIRTYCT